MLLSALTALSLSAAVLAETDEDQVLIIEDSSNGESTDWSAGSDSLEIGDDDADAEIFLIDSTEVEREEDVDGPVLVIEEDGADLILIDEPADGDPTQDGYDTRGIGPTAGQEAASDPNDEAVRAAGAFTIALEDLWGEWGAFYRDAAADQQFYSHLSGQAQWTPSPQWEVVVSLRGDAYFQHGDLDFNDARLDYGDTFVRFSEDKFRVTGGAQTIIWGRIDEFPPNDRLSTQDLTRFILDDLEDRRRASPALRFEYFEGNAKFDVMVLPVFRGAELPDRDSVWFPINRESGEVLGLRTTPVGSEIVRNAPLDLDEPDSEGGVGIRYSKTASWLDWAVTVQRGRQTLPYFSYDPVRAVIETRYPRSTFAGFDLALEALGGTVRFEAAWSSDTPVTRTDGGYDEVESVTWGGAYEIFPGDGDTRLNLQLTGHQLLDAPSVLDRREVYAFNGSLEIPFADDDWRLKMRFNVGLNNSDTYLNPELAYLGWESQEFYIDLHVFDGEDGTPGGFHQDNDMIAGGWRMRF